MNRFLGWLHSDAALKAAAALVSVAIAVRAASSEHTIAWQVADAVVALGAALGVYSTTGREKK